MAVLLLATSACGGAPAARSPSASRNTAPLYDLLPDKQKRADKIMIGPVATYNVHTSGGGNDFEVAGEQVNAGPLGIALGVAFAIPHRLRLVSGPDLRRHGPSELPGTPLLPWPHAPGCGRPAMSVVKAVRVCKSVGGTQVLRGIDLEVGHGGVLDVMRDLARSGATMVVVTHETGFAREVGDVLVFLDEGAIVESGPPYEVPANPRHECTRVFLSKVL
jgi:hypothetical protein